MSKLDDIGANRFREILRKCGGNLSKAAAAMKVSRGSLYNHAAKKEEWGEVIKDERSAILDECIVSARVLALGIPEKDEDGNFIGWRERPDGSMLRYLMSTLGREEGFGESQKMDVSVEDKTIDKINVNIVYNKKEDTELQEKK